MSDQKDAKALAAALMASGVPVGGGPKSPVSNGVHRGSVTSQGSAAPASPLASSPTSSIGGTPTAATPSGVNATGATDDPMSIDVKQLELEREEAYEQVSQWLEGIGKLVEKIGGYRNVLPGSAWHAVNTIREQIDVAQKHIVVRSLIVALLPHRRS